MRTEGFLSFFNDGNEDHEEEDEENAIPNPPTIMEYQNGNNQTAKIFVQNMFHVSKIIVFMHFANAVNNVHVKIVMPPFLNQLTVHLLNCWNVLFVYFNFS